MRVERGDDRTLVAQIDLELAQVLALFQQVRRVGMAQGVDVRGFVHAAGPERQTKGPLQRGARHRLGGGGRALTTVTLGGKEQRGMAMRLPLLPQELQSAVRQGNITVPIAFAGADMQEHPLGINVADRQAQSFAQTQAAGINGAQADAMIPRGHAREDGADFAGGKDDRQFELGIGADQFQFVRPGALQRFFPEQFDRANGLGAGLPGNFLFDLEMKAILADLLGREQIGGLVEELAELAHASVISLLGARADGLEFEIIGEGF